MKVITIQEQMDYLGATSLGQLIVINSEQDEFEKVGSLIDLDWFNYNDVSKLQRTIPMGNHLIKNKSIVPNPNGDYAYIMETTGLCESNGIKFIFNKYEDNGFIMTAYTFLESDLQL
tara:strand:+ start:72251 stop:72601 length:351 start_codon:yes stop_codon:yes gene_type:complete